MEKSKITNLLLAILEEELLSSLVCRETYSSGDMNEEGNSGRGSSEWEEPTWAHY